MRKHLRLSVLALAAMFAGGAYAQEPASVGLSETDNLLDNVTWDNVDNYLWMNDIQTNGGDDETYAKEGVHSDWARNWYWKLLDGDYNTYCQSDWENCDGDATLKNYLDVYLDEKVKGPMVAYIRRMADKGNNHVLEMDVWASDGSAQKYVDSFAGWEKIAHVNVSNPGNFPDKSGKHGMTDIFTAEKPYKYFRFHTTKTDHGSRMNSFHMAEFQLFNLTKDQVAFFNLAAANSNYEAYLETEPGAGIGTDYYQYSDKAAFESFRATLQKIHDIVMAATPVSEAEADALLSALNADWQKVQDSYVLYQVPEAGYYRVEFVKKPGYCAFSNFLYGRAFVGKDDANDARQLWYMEPAGVGKTYATCAADGSFPVQSTGSSIMCFTPRIYTRYKEGNKETNDFTTVACSFDAVKATDEATGLPIVAMRPPSAPNYVEDATKTDSYGSYISSNQRAAIGNTDDCYSSENEVWTNEATWVVLVRVPDAEAKKIIEASSYTAYAQLQEKIEEANDILDIAADAENCFSSDLGELLKDMGGVNTDGDFAPRGNYSLDVDLGSKVEGGVNVQIDYNAGAGNGANPVEWRVYGSNDNANWTLLDPCYNADMMVSYPKAATLPLNLGKGYQYLRFTCWLSWSTDNWGWYENDYNINFRVYKAKRLSTAQIENEASQTLLAAVQAAMAKTGTDATQADVEALAAAIEAYKVGFADPTALRQLLAQTQYLAAGAEYTGEEPGFFTEESGSDFDAAWKAANEYANSGVYTQEQLGYYIENLTALKAEVEDAAIKVETDQFYFLNFLSEEVYDENGWSTAACSGDAGSLFDKFLTAETTEEGSKFLYTDDYDESEDFRSFFGFVQNGDKYAVVNGSNGLYLSIVNGQARLSAEPTYFNVTPVGFGAVVLSAADGVLSGNLDSQSLEVAAEGNCNTNAAFLITSTGEPFDAIEKVEAKSFKSGAIYSIDGKQVNDNFKGVVIKNGSKFLNK